MINLDKDMYLTLKQMWESNQDDNRVLFKGLVINNLDDDLPTKYYKHLLVGVVSKWFADKSFYDMKTLELEFQLKEAGLEDCIVKEEGIL
jgi:hypothetical protein